MKKKDFNFDLLQVNTMEAAHKAMKEAIDDYISDEDSTEIGFDKIAFFINAQLELLKMSVEALSHVNGKLAGKKVKRVIAEEVSRWEF